MSKKYCLLFTIILTASFLHAADIRSGLNITISKPVYGDLYLFGGNILINAPVYGDVVVAGGTVQINDSVMNDVLVAGGRVIITGYVGDDIRCAGGTIVINRYVGGDVLSAGGEVEIGDSGSVQSLHGTGGKYTINGSSRTIMRITAGDIIINGKINGDADIKGALIKINGTINGIANLSATRSISFGKNAIVQRSIHYWLPYSRPLVLPAQIPKYRVIYDPLLSITQARWYFLGATTSLGLLWYLGMAFVLIIIIEYLFRSSFAAAGKTFHTNFIKSVAAGLLYFIMVPVACLVGLLSVVGVPVAFIIMTFYIMFLLLATIISSVVIVHWAAYLSGKSWSFWKMTSASLFTFVLLKILSFTPFLGAFVMLVIASAAFGAVLSNLRFPKYTPAA